MADDSFATPVASLSNTRDADGPKNLNDVASYADLLRQHDSAPQQQGPQDMMMPQASFQAPPPQQMMPTMMPQQPMGPPPPEYQYAPQQQQYGPPPPYDPPVAEKKAWWKLWFYDKHFWVTMITIFLVLYVVYPKVATMPRFAMAPLPTYVLALIAAAGAVVAGAVNMVT